MRKDLRPYWVKRIYLLYRSWYAEHFLRPCFEHLGQHGTYMNPWYVQVAGPNITLGDCATVIGDVDKRVSIAVWGRAPGQGRIKRVWSSSVSPGKPTIKSELRAMSGRMARSLRTVLLYSMAV